jgi:hypothetical protein
MNQTKKNSKKPGAINQTVKVLYQNLGGTWYAFANINEEIFFAPIHFKNVTQSAEAATGKTSRKLAQRPDKDAA